LEEFPLSRIVEITARALSCPTPGGITFAVGRSAKRDMVLVKVVTDEGTVGWGEAHHAQAPSTIAAFVNDALGPSLIGQDPQANEVLWDRVYQRFISTHGPGAAAVISLSGVDLALWDIKGKELGQPVWRLLGGQKRRVPAYAGGISLGFQPVDELAREIEALMKQGYRMVKLRVGDSLERDLMRVDGIRRRFGPELALAADAGTRFHSRDLAGIVEICEAGRLTWLEEPFPPDNLPGYRRLQEVMATPLAAGENHFTRHELRTLISESIIQYVQADCCKAGGISELMKIGALASTWHLAVAPHTSASVLSTGASLAVLSALPNGTWYEADVSRVNAFRDELGIGAPMVVDGYIEASDRPGLGVEIDESVIDRYPVILGASYQ
jgi:L-alanine-DL-glutamate epimerase-like enolase superfamily enzyme